jgi:CheY-like chemotaxis protein
MNSADLPKDSSKTALSLAPILVADDDPDDLFFAVRLIRKTGTRHSVITFDDGASVVDYLTRAWLTPPADRSLLPRLLFLDLKMSGLNGFGFLEWVREHRGRAPLNIVILSGSDEPADVERAKKLGAKRYLAKYPSLATFKTIVHDVHPPDKADAPLLDSSSPFFQPAEQRR